MREKNVLATFWLIVRHETRILAADRTLFLVCGLLALMTGYGLFVGLEHARTRDRMVSDVLEHQAQKEQSNLALLASVLAGKEAPVPFSNPANPAAMAGGLSARHAVIPNAPLSALAIGQSDMIPNYYRITYLSKVKFMYDTEIENPWNLLSGHFDLAFVIVFILPLLIIAMSYSLLSAEREHGTLRMLCSQPLTIATLVAGKVTVRALAVLGTTTLVPIVALLLIQKQATGIAQLGLVLSWAALVIAYGLFWFALAALVNTAGRSSSANALILVVIWTVFVLVVPVSLNVVVAQLSPAPSRTELASHTRVVTGDSLRKYEDLYGADYRYASDPEALRVHDGLIEVPSRMMAFFLAKKDVDEQVEEYLARFDQQLQGQQKWVDRFAVLSPAILVNEAMMSIAGNSSRRYLAFKSQVEAFHNTWREYFYPRILNRKAMTSEDLKALPAWHWTEIRAAETSRDAWWRTALMLALAIGLGAMALMRSRRYSVA